MDKEQIIIKINEIQNLYKNLENEIKGRFIFQNKRFIESDSFSFIKVFRDLYNKYEELCKLEPDTHYIDKLKLVKEKEVGYLESFEKRCNKLSKDKETKERRKLMQDVVDHVRMAIPEIFLPTENVDNAIDPGL